MVPNFLSVLMTLESQASPGRPPQLLHPTWRRLQAQRCRPTQTSKPTRTLPGRSPTVCSDASIRNLGDTLSPQTPSSPALLEKQTQVCPIICSLLSLPLYWARPPAPQRWSHVAASMPSPRRRPAHPGCAPHGVQRTWIVPPCPTALHQKIQWFVWCLSSNTLQTNNRIMVKLDSRKKPKRQRHRSPTLDYETQQY